MGLFDQNKKYVPVWFMRQAGRYHQHYQGIRQKHDFMGMCKDPELAQEITLGPINDFNFDAAILFSDLLFPLEQLGLGLSYHSGPPTLEKNITSSEIIKQLRVTTPSQEFYNFQKQATHLLRQTLPASKSLLGFAGAPFTLYTYAMEGAHKGNLIESKKGLYDGRYRDFLEILSPLIVDELSLQAEGGADGLCLFDTAAGELSLSDYERFVVPGLNSIMGQLKQRCPDKKIIYYSKHTHLDYYKALAPRDADVLGVDWRMNLINALKELGDQYFIQGNIDPVWLFLPWNELQANLKELWNKMNQSSAPLDKWIFGLGHGVLPKTPESNVKNTVNYIQANYQL